MAEEQQKEHQQQALEPVEQETVPFKNGTIVAVRLADGRICVVVRWICERLQLDTQGQVQRIQRTRATASELVRVRVQTKGGRQTMPALTLRGFSPWILGINPNEVRSEDPIEDERIRGLILAYQEEAKDVLYEHFMRRRPALSAARTVIPAEPAPPQELGSDATDAEQATYYEQLALWAMWKAGQHAQQWRREQEAWRGSIENRLESQEALSALFPEILERLGPEKLTPEHQQLLQVYVTRLHEATGKHRNTIHSDLKMAFNVPRYQELLEEDWGQVEQWFKVQIGRARESQKKPQPPR